MNAPAPRPNVRLTVATVETVRQISPSFRRVRLRGDFTAFATGGLHFRFMFGPPGAPLPTLGARGPCLAGRRAGLASPGLHRPRAGPGLRVDRRGHLPA